MIAMVDPLFAGAVAPSGNVIAKSRENKGNVVWPNAPLGVPVHWGIGGVHPLFDEEEWKGIEMNPGYDKGSGLPYDILSLYLMCQVAHQHLHFGEGCGDRLS